MERKPCNTVIPVSVTPASRTHKRAGQTLKLVIVRTRKYVQHTADTGPPEHGHHCGDCAVARGETYMTVPRTNATQSHNQRTSMRAHQRR